MQCFEHGKILLEHGLSTARARLEHSTIFPKGKAKCCAAFVHPIYKKCARTARTP